MAKGLHSLTKSGKIHTASYEEVAKWVDNAWKSIKKNAIISGFKDAGLLASDTVNNLSKENGTSSDDEDTDMDSSMDEDMLNLFNLDNDESNFEGFS